MQIKPVTKADKPEYPTASELDIPEVLNASKPNKWKRNAAIGAVMLGMVGSISSCINLKSNHNTISGIAPLFVHGEGIGCTGCISVSPPVYLSENEARKVIIDELKINDIHCSKNNDSTKGVTVIIDRLTSESYYSPATKQYENTTVTKIMPFDVYLDSSDFALLFISIKKYTKYCDINSHCTDIKQFAIRIQEAGKKQNKSFATFYEPITTIEPGTHYFWEDDNKTIALKKSKKELRKQVQDFIKWYKENKGKK